MNALSNGMTIELENGTKFHTLDDWNLALENNNYIGEPELETWYVNVPFRSGLLDFSEALSGRRIFKSRPLAFNLGGIRERVLWDNVISDLRNKIHGKKCKITLDNDIDHYWYGRVYISDFDRIRELGRFTLNVPEADPYKYNILSSAEPWKWDPFSFVNGVITSIGEHIIDGTETVTLPRGYMEVSPEFVCAEVLDLKVEANGREYTLTNGSNRFPSLLVNGPYETKLTFTGKGKVSIVYRGGSL